MLDLELRFEDGTIEGRCLRLPVDVGRAAAAGLHLKAWRVAKRHARIEQRDGGVFIEDFGALSGTLVNGTRITQYGPLHAGDEIIIGPCLMLVRGLPGLDVDEHLATLPLGPHANHGPACRQSRIALSNEVSAAEAGAILVPPRREVESARDAGSQSDVAMPVPPPTDQWLLQRRRLHVELLDALDLRRRDIANMSDEALRAEASQVLSEIIANDSKLPASIDRRALLAQVVDEAVGLGPLEPLLNDDSVTEIMVNRHDEIFVEIQGRITRHIAVFSSEQAVLGVIERIVSPLGRRVDESSPMVDARLRDGSRVNAVVGPVALRGASLTIRKFPRFRPTMVDLRRIGALDQAMCEFLSACVRTRKNMLVSGGTGSGKTTLLNILSNCIPGGERIITIEDAAELRLNHQNLVALESRPANLEGRGKIEIRDLVRNALRMRPDRIVIGECRGGEAFDMLAAMNTGHEGSLTTLHANSPRDALSRLETMILMAGMDLPLSAVREHIAASIDIIVQQARLHDGRRLVTSIVEVTGIESGRIQTQELFRYVRSPVAAFRGCGIVPECFADEKGAAGLPSDLFDRHTPLDTAADSQLVHD